MKIVICDDQIEHCLKTKSIIEQYLKNHHVVADVLYCTTGKQLLEEKNVDVIFMDIQLHDENGIDVIKQVNEKTPRTLIVYLTNHVFYASAVYATKHTFFVLKDDFANKINEVFEHIYQDLAKIPVKVVFTNKGDEFVSLHVNEIVYIERKNRVTYIHTTEKIFEVQEKVTEIMNRLPQLYFLRCHNSYIVYIPVIKELTKSEIVLDSGQIIPVSRNYRKKAQDAFALWASTQ